MTEQEHFHGLLDLRTKDQDVTNCFRAGSVAQAGANDTSKTLKKKGEKKRVVPNISVFIYIL